MPVQTQGHTGAHASFFMEWNGYRVICTGDSVQHGGGVPVVPMPILYNGAAWPDLGPVAALKRIQQLRPDWIICGHGLSFFDPDGAIISSLIRETEKVQKEVAKLVPEGDLFRAMEPPGYAAFRKKLEQINK